MNILILILILAYYQDQTVISLNKYASYIYLQELYH